jgi:hypothetical protein
MTTPFPFVSGAVLTAAQLNAITEVPVSAKTASYTLAATDAGSRITMSSASSTTITVNTALFSAGQSLRIQNIGAGVCTVTAGTATVTSAGPLALVQWAGGQLYFTSASAAVWFPDAVTATASGLVYITGASFTAQSTVSMAASTFTTAYKTYKVILQLTAVSADLNVLCRVNVGGTPNSTSGQYQWSRGGNFFNSAANDQGNNTTQTSAQINQARNSSYMAYATNDMTVYDPANSATMTNVNGNQTGAIDSNTIGGAGDFGFTMTATAANDGLTFLTSTGTMTGLYRVYAMSES